MNDALFIELNTSQKYELKELCIIGILLNKEPKLESCIYLEKTFKITLYDK